MMFEGQNNTTLWEQMKSKFGQAPPDFQILIYQNGASDNKNGFVVYQGKDITSTREALRCLQTALAPLLYKGSVTLTAALLKAVILPKPSTDKKTTTIRLLEVIQSKPEAHSEWYTIIQLLEEKDVEKTKKKSSKSFDESDKGFFNSLKRKPKPKASKSVDEVDLPNPQVAESQPKVKPNKRVSKFLEIESYNFLAPVTKKSDETVATEKDVDNDISEKVWRNFKKRTIIKKRCDTTDDVVEIAPIPAVDHKEEMPALMLAIEKGYVKSAFNLLLAGSDPNCHDEASGNTPLHVAARNDNLLMIKLLVVFNANVLIANHNKEMPLDIVRGNASKESPSIATVLEEVARLQTVTRDYFSSHKTSKPKDLKKGQFLISMDGGGTRAFNIVQALIAIEDRLKQLNPKCKPLASYFDIAAGTSAGAIAGAVLMYTNADARIGRYLVYKTVTDVFKKKLSQRGERMDQYLQDIFGIDRLMNDISQSQKMIITGTLANRNPNKLHLMTSYGESRDGHPGPNHRKIWEAVRISSAAPIYFPPFNDAFLDGGLMANNPTLDAMAEIFEENKKQRNPPKLTFVLSLGTGIPKVKSVDNIEVFVPGISFKSLSNIHSSLKGFASLFDHLLTQVTQSDGQEVTKAKTFCDAIGCKYFRLSPPLQGDIDPATTSKAVIIDMMYQAQIYILSIPEQIDTIANCLLSK
jgi:calcium-independent phospholipase A2